MNPGNYGGIGMRVPAGQPQMGQMGMGQPGMRPNQMNFNPMGQPRMGQPQTGQPLLGLQQRIHQQLQTQQIPPGWQQTYRIEMRTNFIFQM